MNSRRAAFLVTLVSLGFVTVVLRLVDLMILEHDWLSQRAHRQHVRSETVAAPRGTIYDARMRELAVNRRVQSVYGVPREVGDPRRVAGRLSPVLGLKKTLLTDRLSDRDKGFVWLARKVDEETVKTVKALNLSPEIGFIPETKRTYPKGSLASHVIGFVDIDNRGTEGIERIFEDVLRGESGRVMKGRDALGQALSSGEENAQTGNDVVLTLDEDLQYIVEDALNEAVERYRARGGVSIMMDPYTGRVLAMAVNPTFSPEKRGRPERWRNRAVTDVYEPGSTFKAILAAAALEEKRVRVSDRFDCSEGVIEVGGRRIHDHKRQGVLTFEEVVQKSSNVGMVKVAQLLGGETYFRYITAFGFGEKTGLTLSGEVKGLLKHPKDWSGSSIGAMAVGYEVAATPLQILNAYAAIANGGVLMRPYIVSDILDSEGRVVKRFEPEPVRRVISERTSRILTEILETVVQDGGTAVNASVLGNRVAGKTGTSRKIDSQSGRYSRTRYYSSFVGYVPCQNPKLAMIVVIDEPKGAIYGGEVAAPVFRKIAEHALIYLNIPREDTGHVVLVSG